MPPVKRIETRFIKEADIYGLTPQDSVLIRQQRSRALIAFFVLITLTFGSYQRIIFLVFRTFMVNRLQTTLRAATLLLLAAMAFSLHNFGQISSLLTC
jgi:hypothetical protein